MTEVEKGGRRTEGWVTKKTKTAQKQNWLWIITCCGEAKLTVLGTSYAIWVETPPMSRTPAVRFLTSASCWSPPGTFTSTTASPSKISERREVTESDGQRMSSDYCVNAHPRHVHKLFWHTVEILTIVHMVKPPKDKVYSNPCIDTWSQWQINIIFYQHHQRRIFNNISSSSKLM